MVQPSDGAHRLGIHQILQKAIEKTLFHGKSTKTSLYIAYVIGNVLLMLVLFFLVLNTLAYDWTGQLYPTGSGLSLATSLDNALPFTPQWVIFYVYVFYPLAFLTMAFFGFYEYKRGYSLGWSLVIINAISIAIYIVFPVSTFAWRQQYLAQPSTGNFWAKQVYGVWAGDTSFNCFPSLHAAVSTACFYAWFRYAKAKPSATNKAFAVATLIIAAGLVISTLFVKQHYIADEVAGVILALVVSKIAFDHLQKNPKDTS